MEIIDITPKGDPKKMNAAVDGQHDADYRCYMVLEDLSQASGYENLPDAIRAKVEEALELRRESNDNLIRSVCGR